MKTTIKIAALLVTLSLMSFSVQQTTGSEEMNVNTSLNTIKWKTEEIQLGEIPQNKPVTIDFEFTNEGKNPVIISNVQAACGCTATDYSRLPILPGASTKISATFNAAVKGVFKKTITVTTNAEEAPKVLTFTGTVI